MRIASIQLGPFRLSLRRPLRTAQGTIALREGWWIAVSDGEGRWGLGEAAPLLGFAMETRGRCADVLARWQGQWRGRELDEEALRQKGLGALAGDAADAPAAAHGLELALLDLAAQRAGLPLARWLERDAAREVPVNATLGAEAPEEAARLAASAVAEGFHTLKVKIGAGALQEDLARVQAVREAAGPGVRLRVDANGAWTRQAALDALHALAPLNIEYAEQPVSAAELSDLAWLSARSPVPIAADESACTVPDARRVIESGAARVLVLKPMSLGGLVPTLAVARLAAAAGLTCVVTTTLDSAVARTGALHAAAALGGASAARREDAPAHGLATGTMLAEDATDDAPAPQGGMLAVPVFPGLGLRNARTRLFPGAGGA